MSFEGLRINYLLHNEDASVPIQNKQRLNLSHHAHTVLLNDMDAFHMTDDAKRKPQKTRGIPSSVVNQIFCSYCKTAHASIAATLEHLQMELEGTLGELQQQEACKETCKNAIKKLLECREEELKQEIGQYNEKCHTFSIWLDTRTIEYLVGEGQKEASYHEDNVGCYIKHVIEEYARLPNIERERICCKEILDTILAACREKKLLKLTLHSKKGDSLPPQNNKMYFKPVDVRCDTENLYNYLVGSMAEKPNGPWKWGAVRLTSIKDCDELKTDAFISAGNRKELENAIRQSGVQYLSDGENIWNIRVQFTKAGEYHYNQWLHQRPLYVQKDEQRVYEFACTRYQAKAYFFKFGHDVKILAPAELAKEFARDYRRAASRYAAKNENTDGPCCAEPETGEESGVGLKTISRG